MIGVLANHIVNYIEKNNDGHTVNRSIMLFALQSLLTNILTIILCLLIGWGLGTFQETCLVLVTTALVRNLTGGLHFSSPMTCVVISTLIVTSIPHIPVSDMASTIFMFSSLILVLWFAPADLKGKTRISDRGLNIMKVAGILLISSNFFIKSELLSLSFFCASITLIPFKNIHNFIKGGKMHA